MKKYSNYKKIETTGEVKKIDYIYVHYINSLESGLRTCPYVDLIPLRYLSLYHNNIPTMKSLGMYGKRDIEHREIMERNKKYIEFDEVCGLCNMEPHTSYRRHIISDFSYAAWRFTQRSYRGMITPYSLFLKRDYYEPHILPVILPENYLYMKYNMLLTGEIDLSMVIILINKDLDKPSFPVKGFRRLYKELLPDILNTSCQVWEVPYDFIIKSCFLNSFKLKSTNIFERKKELNLLLKELYEKEFTKPMEDEVSLSVLTSSTAASNTINSGTVTLGGVTYEGANPYVPIIEDEEEMYEESEDQWEEEIESERVVMD